MLSLLLAFFCEGLYLVPHNMIISAFGLYSTEGFFLVRSSKSFFFLSKPRRPFIYYTYKMVEGGFDNENPDLH